ncbi:MAG: uroporphyrinogen decarboxylase family protein, partial [Verrucomicrobiae bacterium]|nr:uroporphyrinogen decarboxylase family protein [Verrucomicrobiae bacterium]
MTSRERLLATLRGQLPDRVPVAPFVQEEYLAFYYPHKTTVDRVLDATELANELDFDLMAKHRALETPHFFRRSYPNWELRRSESRTGGMIVRRLEIVTPVRTLLQ